MTETQLIAKWEARAVEYDQLGACVDGEKVARAFLDDLAQVRLAAENRVLSLAEAAKWCGYSEAHLRRLVKQGRLETLRPPGSRGRLTFRQAALPRKPGPRHPTGAGVHELASRLGIRGKEGRDG